MQRQPSAGHVQHLDAADPYLSDKKLVAGKREGAVGRIAALQEQPLGDAAIRIEHGHVALAVDRAVESAVDAKLHAVRAFEVVAFEGLQDVAKELAPRLLRSEHVV